MHDGLANFPPLRQSRALFLFGLFCASFSCAGRSLFSVAIINASPITTWHYTSRPVQEITSCPWLPFGFRSDVKPADDQAAEVGLFLLLLLLLLLPTLS